MYCNIEDRGTGDLQKCEAIVEQDKEHDAASLQLVLFHECDIAQLSCKVATDNHNNTPAMSLVLRVSSSNHRVMRQEKLYHLQLSEG